MFDDRQHDSARSPIKINIGRIVTNVKNHITDDAVDIDVAFSANFSGNVDEATRREAFNGDSRGSIMGKNGIENRIRQLVAQLIRMTARDGFARENAESHRDTTFCRLTMSNARAVDLLRAIELDESLVDFTHCDGERLLIN
ncbi:unannotated protein [freshwater metagenome]|uniref:Unannotated protein n=1 Tax=freshwater metagenome TaxID=449393 RepID=A0A6J6BMK5_9ZZZZ